MLSKLTNQNSPLFCFSALLRKVTKFQFSKLVSPRVSSFFQKDFKKHKNNTKLVSQHFESLSLSEKLSVIALFSQGVRNGKDKYSSSRAVDWLLHPKNLEALTAQCAANIESLDLQSVHDLMVLVDFHEREDLVPEILARLRGLSRSVGQVSDLSKLFACIQLAKSLPSCRWASVHQILELSHLKELEKSTRRFRTPAQEVVLFNFFKELDFEELSFEELHLLESIIQNVQDVDPALYLKLTMSLLSHFLLDFASKQVEGRPLQKLMRQRQISKEQLKSEVPAVEYLEQLGSKEYDPDLFSSEQLLETLTVFPSLASTVNVSFYSLFPQLGDRISRIASLNLKRNFGNRAAVEQIFEVTRIPQSLQEANAQLLMHSFSESLVNYAELHEQLISTVADKSLLAQSGDISESLRSFRAEVDFETRTITTPVLELVSGDRYTDLLKLSMFFEACFFYAFPICFYCSQYKMINPRDSLLDSFFQFSADLLLYICRMGKVIIRKIREFDLQQSLAFVEKKFAGDPQRLETEVARLRKFDRHNALILQMIANSLRSKRSYLIELGKDGRSLELIDKIQQLEELLKGN